MSDTLTRLRAITSVLPEVTESLDDGQPVFAVAGEPFARCRTTAENAPAAVAVRTSDADELARWVEGNPDRCRASNRASEAGWLLIDLADDPDWALVDDRVARSWELAAPARLLEAGGR